MSTAAQKEEQHEVRRLHEWREVCGELIGVQYLKVSCMLDAILDVVSMVYKPCLQRWKVIMEMFL